MNETLLEEVKEPPYPIDLLLHCARGAYESLERTAAMRGTDPEEALCYAISVAERFENLKEAVKVFKAGGTTGKVVVKTF